MKILLTILLIFISTTVFAKPKSIYKVDIRNDKGLQKFYWKNIEKANDDQVIVIPKGSLRCTSYNRYLKAYKYLLGGGRDIVYLGSIHCYVLRSKSFGLITESFKDSQVVKLAFRAYPITKQIVSGYFGTSALMTLAQFKNSIK